MSSAATSPSWNGEWVSCRTNQGSAREVTSLPTVEMDEPAQKRRKTAFRQIDGVRSSGSVSADAPPDRAGPGSLARDREDAPPAREADRSSPSIWRKAVFLRFWAGSSI